MGKKLVAGDAIVYIKDVSQDIIFGIRRRKQILSGTVTESAVLEAVELAEQKSAWNCGIRVRLLPQKVESKKSLLRSEGTICRVLMFLPGECLRYI
jgi:hypothetical protein